MLETQSSEKREVIATHRGPGSASPPADSGLRCPACEYNLTGVAEDRCPECGKTFDRGQLVAALAGAPSPIPIWDDASRNVVLRFIHICLLTWFRPVHFAAILPKRPSPASLRRFRYVVTGVFLSLVTLAGGRLAGPIDGALHAAAGGLLVLPALLLAELSVAHTFSSASYAQPGTPYKAILAEYNWWRGFLGLFRGFLLLGSAAFALAVFLDPSHFGLWLLVPPLWWYCCACGVLLQKPATLGPKIAMIIITPLLWGFLMALFVAFAVGFGIIAFALAGL